MREFQKQASLFLGRWLKWTIAITVFKTVMWCIRMYLARNPAAAARVWSLLISWFQQRVNAGTRARFQRAFQLYHVGVRKGHPHGDAATNRNSATAAMHACARAMGCTPYVVSPSQRETCELGSRDYYQLNDYVQDLKADKVPDDACLIMTDIDYYVDWSYWMSYGRPVLMYSFVPETPGDSIPEGMFCIKDNIVESKVSGGGTYRHPLWDYNCDSAWVPSDGNSWLYWFQSYLGFCLGVWRHSRVTLFSIDQWKVGVHRRVIALVPYATGPDWIVLGQEASRLRRFEPQVGGRDKFNVMRVLTDDGPVVAVSRAGDPVSAVLPEGKFVGASIRFKSSVSKNLSDVVRYVGDVMPVDRAAILAAYLAENLRPEMPTVSGAGTPAEHYLCIATDKVEDGKTYARRYAPKPLSSEAVFPVECRNNEEICILKRITEPQEKSSSAIAKSNPRVKGTPPGRFAKYASEFVQAVVSQGENAGCGHPLNVDDVVQRQDLPRQRERSLRRMCDWAEKFVVSAFQKREPYAAPSDPRNISGCPTTHVLRLSSYTLAFKECVMKTLPWYMPGRTPVEVATALMELANANDSLVEGDYSRFDGSISRWLRVNVEFPCYQSWVHPQHSCELNDLLTAELDPKAFTKLNLKYSPGCSRLSGSPLTTDGNTLINAYVGFATCRELGADVDWSFKHSGVYFGDDSLMTGRMNTSKQLGDLLRVASAVGLQLKAKVVPKHSPVMFLSRCFPDLWTSPDSFADPLRAMLKIHTTVDTTSDIALCGFNKASAYLVTDAKTPFVANWCNAYLRALGRVFEEHRVSDLPYWYVIPEYRAAPWPQTSIPNCVDLVASSLGVRADELSAHCKVLDDFSGRVDELPVLGVAAQVAKVACVVGGEIVGPGDASFDTCTDSDSLQLSNTQQHDVSGTVLRSGREGDSTGVQRGNSSNACPGNENSGVPTAGSSSSASVPLSDCNHRRVAQASGASREPVQRVGGQSTVRPTDGDRADGRGRRDRVPGGRQRPGSASEDCGSARGGDGEWHQAARGRRTATRDRPAGRGEGGGRGAASIRPR